ncbi:fc4f2143-e815-4eb9-a4e4-e1d4db6ea257 [Sclerotinia trifoliorum]|uniref:Fc4f2143-e815-4eb9-a4e4-e1d4db6ea257 n=1 Tax=Sclerotinia trifoliorum TaxID=28548 RepID=A0A8H2VQ27_9HELO|nr:fc4f2143-e815-4eb9-a4e4-e1d4db6ea257 [Sclerotinia trifoliorum]
MSSLKHFEMLEDEFFINDQRRNKTQRTRVKGLIQRSEYCQQALDHKKDTFRGDDKPLDQEIKAAREDNELPETLSDLSM